LDLSPAQTTSASKHSFTGASDVDTARQPDLPDFVQLVEAEDQRLFRRINNNSTHVLRGLLPPPSMATQQ